jgi:hypothetical protein
MKRAIVAGLVVVMMMCLGGTAFAYSDVKPIYLYAIEMGGFTPGDAPGFPLTISQPGSYRLVENITVPNSSTTAIEVTADNVTIDLNGFAIFGPVSCTACVGNAASMVCSPTGAGRGISSADERKNLKVMNGTVKGMGGIGIRAGDATIENVRVINNGNDGIYIQLEGRVRSVSAASNGATGIDLGGHGMVSGSSAECNKNIGISLGLGNVSGSIADGNGSYGIRATGTVTGNTSSYNADDGIRLTGGIATGNTLFRSTGHGLDMDSSAGYSNNVLSGNTAGDATGGVDLGGNLCSGVLCP